jgi:PASTA domain
VVIVLLSVLINIPAWVRGCAGPPTVPSVVGQTLDAASSRLGSARISGKISFEDPSDSDIWVRADWIVCSASPPAGSKATTVNLVVGHFAC